MMARPSTTRLFGPGSVGRVIALPVLDCCCWAAALIVACVLRYQFNLNRAFTADLVFAIAVAVASQLIVGSLLLYSRRWIIGSFEEIITLAGTVGVTTLVVLPVSMRTFAENLGVADIRPATDEDLLGRKAVDTEIESIADYLTGHRVLVMGAVGSIGSELCRQIPRFSPSVRSGLLSQPLQACRITRERGGTVRRRREANRLRHWRRVYARRAPDRGTRAPGPGASPRMKGWPPAYRTESSRSDRPRLPHPARRGRACRPPNDGGVPR
jgi:hypothetical protein